MTLWMNQRTKKRKNKQTKERTDEGDSIGAFSLQLGTNLLQMLKKYLVSKQNVVQNKIYKYKLLLVLQDSENLFCRIIKQQWVNLKRCLYKHTPPRPNQRKFLSRFSTFFSFSTIPVSAARIT